MVCGVLIMSNETETSRTTKIFISYSRRNKVFVKKLNDALDSAGIDAWVDWEGIPLSSDWMAEISAAIEAADAFVFVISPDSLKSKICMDELELGVKYNKKIIPVLYLEPQKGQDMHPKLASTNWVYMRPKKDDFKATVPKLISAIQTDLGWLQKHTRLLQRSLEWDGKQRNHSYLLQGADLDDGEDWATQANPEVGRTVVSVQAEYIHESRKTAVCRQRNLTIGIGVALVFSVLMGIFAFMQRSVALENEQKAKSSQATAVANEMARATQQVIAEENAKIAEENANIAKAQRSASEARIYQSEAGKLNTSTLLAVDAFKKLPTLRDAEDVLRSNISMLPVPIKQINVGARISKIQTSPDRTKFVSSDESGQACVWSAEDGEKFFCVQQEGVLYDSIFSRDGKLIATGSSKGVVSLWNAETGKLEKSFQLKGVIWDLQAHPNGSWLGVAASYGVTLIDMEKLKELTTNVTASDVYKIDFSSSGKYLAIGQVNGSVSVWDIPNGRTLAGPQHNNEVIDVSFSPDGNWVISAGADSTSRAMKIGDGRQKYSITHGDWVEYTAFGPDGSWYVTVSDDNYVRVIDTISGQEKLRMAHDSFGTRARISSNGQWIASTSYDHTARVWDALNGTQVIQVPVADIGSAIEFNPTATRLIVGDRQGNITLWDTSSLQQREGHVPFTDYLHEANFSPDGKWLVANADDKKVWIIPSDKLGSKDDERKVLFSVKGLTYDTAISGDSKWFVAVEYDSVIAEYNRAVLSSMDGAKKITLTHDLRVIQYVIFTPDSKQVITADESGVVYLWDVETGERKGELQADGVILSLAISPDGKYLVAGIEEGNVNVVWDLTTMTQVATLDQIGATNIAEFSPDGKWLATGGSESSVQLWHAGDGTFAPTENVFNTVGGLFAAKFSPDSAILSVGDSNGYVYLFDMNRMEEVARLRHVDKITGISFSPDGKRMAVAAQKSAALWDVLAIPFLYRDQLIETACSRLVENLSDSDWQTIFGAAEYQLTCPNLPAGKN